MNRYIILVKSEDKIKIAQYGHDDGNPAGAGMDILNFLKENSMSMFRRFLKDVKSYPPGFTKEARRGLYPEYMLGTQVLTEVIEGERTQVVMDPHFQDDAFCDWVYIIDLDGEMFMVRKGANASFSLNKLPGMDEFLDKCDDGYDIY